MDSLKRLLRIRTLLEEAGLAELERETWWATRIETALEGMNESIETERMIGLEALAGSSSGPRLLADASREIAERQAAKLRPALMLQEAKVSAAKYNFLAKRRDRRQVETVLETQRLVRSADEARREQQQMDEWHAVRAMAAKRRGRLRLR